MHCEPSIRLGSEQRPPATGIAPGAAVHQLGNVHRSWRPAFGSFVTVFVVFGTVSWLSHAARPGTGAIGWYVTVVWTVPFSIAVVGLAGGLITAMDRRHQKTEGAAIVSELLVVVVPTIGRSDTVPALERVVGSLCRYLPAHFPNLRIDIVVEERCDARDKIVLLENPHVRIVTVPTSYRTRNGTQFKARANHYAHELRLLQAEATEDVWVLHMDDDTAVGEDTAESLAAFIAAQHSAQRRLHLAQGVLSYPREYAAHRLTWLADAVRPGCDISLFAASTGLGTPRTGLHGELLLVRASIEASIGWDFGPRSIVEDAEFALHFCDRYPGRSGWISGRSYGASPASADDLLRQRERWVWGLLELVTKASIPLRQRLVLLHNVVVWTFGPFQHPALILLVGAIVGDLDTSPATAILVPLWAFNMSYFVWLYWEGLKINASSSAAPRLWWEPLALVALLPLFSLWEMAGIIRGLRRFARKGQLEFTVIAKPI